MATSTVDLSGGDPSIDPATGVAYADEVSGFGPTAPGSSSGLGALSPDMSTSQLDVSSPAATDGPTTSLLSSLGSLTNLGYGVASAATGRPVVTAGGVTTLGQAPLVTGTLNLNMVLTFGLIAFALWAIFKE